MVLKDDEQKRRTRAVVHEAMTSCADCGRDMKLVASTSFPTVPGALVSVFVCWSCERETVALAGPEDFLRFMAERVTSQLEDEANLIWFEDPDD